MAAVINKSNLLMIVKAKDLPPADLEKQENRKKAKAKKEAAVTTKEKNKKEKTTEIDAIANDIAFAKAKNTKKTAVVPVVEQLPEIVVADILEQPPEPVQAKKVLPPIPERTDEEREAIIQKYKLENGKKVLPPIPERTEEEYLSARERYRREQAEIFAALPRRIPACVGQVSGNLAPDLPCEQMTPWLRGRFIKRLTSRLLVEPSLAIPTWEVLMNNDLTIRKKVEHLQALGWEPELLSLDKYKFPRLMVLARILEQGII